MSVCRHPSGAKDAGVFFSEWGRIGRHYRLPRPLWRPCSFGEFKKKRDGYTQLLWGFFRQPEKDRDSAGASMLRSRGSNLFAGMETCGPACIQRVGRQSGAVMAIGSCHSVDVSDSSVRDLTVARSSCGPDIPRGSIERTMIAGLNRLAP